MCSVCVRVRERGRKTDIQHRQTEVFAIMYGRTRTNYDSLVLVISSRRKIRDDVTTFAQAQVHYSLPGVLLLPAPQIGYFLIGEGELLCHVSEPS